MALVVYLMISSANHVGAKIYTVHQAQRLILKEPKIIEYAGLVTEEED